MPSGNPSLDADEKRKLQNRAAQRAFRERKEKHLAELEARVEAQDAILASCRGTIHRCGFLTGFPSLSRAHASFRQPHC